jgi:class 3 adenylate cyclase
MQFLRMKWKLSAWLLFCTLLGGLTPTLYAQSVAELKNNLRRAQTKNERMQISYDLAQALMNGRNFGEAADMAYQAYELAIQLGEKRMASDAILLSGDAHYRRKKYPEASARLLDAWNTARNYGHRDVAIAAAERLMNINKEQKNLAEALKWSQEMIQYLRENTGRGTTGGDALRRLESQIAALEAENRSLKEQIAQLSSKTQEIESAYKQQIRQVQAISQQELGKREAEITLTRRQADSLEDVKNRLLKTMTESQMIDSMIKAQQEREIQRQKAIAAQLEVERQKSEAARNLLLVVSAVILIIAALLFLLYQGKQRTARALAAKNRIIEEERKRSDELLLNILPPAVAQELKTKNKVAARKYEEATVMFIDFVGFTHTAEKLTPEQLVSELDYCFTSFDRIIGQYRIEKIKTVGDAYICASGLSDKNASPSDMVKAALQIQDFLLHLKAERMSQGLPYFEARVGIHTGPVVAGVVGEKKFAYDIWGDTVNTAARVEQACEPGRVNVSESTYWKAKYEFEWLPRGVISTKNKAPMEMYYVTGVREVRY